MKRQNVRTLSLIVCTFSYLLVGAAVFDALESEFETKEDRRLMEQEASLQKQYGITQEDMDIMTKHFLRKKGYNEEAQWRFAGAFYFATTVITTIGYGHNTPKTTGGKIFCMAYALPGIPLCIVMFQSIGERMNAFLTFLLGGIKSCLRLRRKEVSQTNLILVSSNLCGIVVFTGSVAFSYYEDWDYLNSFYYCFITLTTIGFGDFVALQRDNSLSRRPDYVAFSLIFILFGLTVVSSAMNLLVLRFLTMNTVDERRDEIAAAAAGHDPLHLEGDVIYTSTGNTILGANGTLPMGVGVYGEQRPSYSYSNTVNMLERGSICSCTRYCASMRNNSTDQEKFSTRFNRKKKQLIYAHRIRTRYTRTRGPGFVHHLAEQKVSYDNETMDFAGESETILDAVTQPMNSLWSNESKDNSKRELEILANDEELLIFSEAVKQAQLRRRASL